MSDRPALDSTMLTLIRKANPHENLRRQQVLAWAVTGLLQEKPIALPLWANGIVSAAQAASRVRRLRRFLANPRVPVRSYYDGLIRTTLATWAGQTLYLALDTTTLAGRWVIGRIALVDRGRAVPLVWQVYPRRCLTLACADYQDLLQHTPCLWPQGVRVVLLGDRGCRTPQLMAGCQTHSWHFRLRLKGNQSVTLPDGQVYRLADLRLRRGRVRFLQGVRLNQDPDGPLDIALAWVDTAEAEPWSIATDDVADHRTLTEYGWRRDIDASFRDDQSGGFQLEDCQLADAASISRLLLVMAVACLYLVSLGTWVVETEQRQSVDPHRGRGLSYFQMGWRWLRRLMHSGSVVVSLLRLSPDPDPAPVTLPRGKRIPPSWVEWLPADGAP